MYVHANVSTAKRQRIYLSEVLMNENQANAIEHFEYEVKRYARMAERCRTIQMPILGYFCDETSRRMREAVRMQKDLFEHPERYLVTENFTPEKK